MLEALLILFFCCVITGIYLFVVKEQIDESEKAEQ
jgi:hypothetical protein